VRHLPENFRPADHFELTLTVDVELVASEATDEGRLMSVRVIALKNRSNGQAVLWSVDAEGSLDLEVHVGAKQRLLALGLSARQRESLKERLAGLSPIEASKLLKDLTNHSGDA